MWLPYSNFKLQACKYVLQACTCILQSLEIVPFDMSFQIVFFELSEFYSHYLLVTILTSEKKTGYFKSTIYDSMSSFQSTELASSTY